MNKHTKGPWTVGYRTLTIQAPSEKGGTFPVCDIRGWGYLTGNGSGALGLDADEAEAIQTANARLIAAAPAMLGALKAMVVEFKQLDLPYGSAAYLLATTAVNSAEAQP